jgi:hypothetical protein
MLPDLFYSRCVCGRPELGNTGELWNVHTQRTVPPAALIATHSATAAVIAAAAAIFAAPPALTTLAATLTTRATLTTLAATLATLAATSRSSLQFQHPDEPGLDQRR